MLRGVILRIKKQITATKKQVWRATPPLPKATRLRIALLMPWVSFIMGVCFIWAAWRWWQQGQSMELLSDSSALGNAYAAAQSFTIQRNIWDWVGVLLLLYTGLVLIRAFVPLMQRHKTGWKQLVTAQRCALIVTIATVFAATFSGAAVIYLWLCILVSIYVLSQTKSVFTRRAKPKKTSPYAVLRRTLR